MSDLINTHYCDNGERIPAWAKRDCSMCDNCATVATLEAENKKLRERLEGIGECAAAVAETVNHPAHYNGGGQECITAIRSALSADEFAGFCKGNVIKYLWRERAKGGSEDIRKARWYMQTLVDFLNDD